MADLSGRSNAVLSTRTVGNESTADTLATDVEPVKLSREFVDHFTLSAPSSIVRFRSRHAAARVFENKSTQFVLEENYDPNKRQRTIVVKQMIASTRTLQVLRTIYTIIAVFWTGILCVFCLQVLLFLVLDMALESGRTSVNASARPGILIGVFFAIVILVEGFASALVISSAYCAELWSGHYFMKQFVFLTNNHYTYVTAEWVFFVFFLGMPILVICGTLLARMEYWWTVSSLFWFSSVTFVYCIFALKVVFSEIQAAITFVRNRHRTKCHNLVDVIRECILLRQVHAYSGREMDTYLARSYFNSSENSENTNRTNIIESTRTSNHTNLWAQFTKMGFVRTDVPGGVKLFKPLPEPVRLYKIDDVQDYRPFLTKSTWGLERIFCRSKDSRYIAIVDGPGALTRSQIQSNIVCSLIGTLLILLLCIGFLVWLEADTTILVVAAVILAGLAWRSQKRLRQFANVAKNYIDIRTELKQSRSERLEDSRTPLEQAVEIELGPTDDGDSPPLEAPSSNEQDNEQEGDQGNGDDGKTIDEMMIRKTRSHSLKQEKPQRTSSSVRFNDEESNNDTNFVGKHSIHVSDSVYHAPIGDSKRKWDKEGATPSEGLYLVTQYNRVTKATRKMCWIMFAIEHLLFFVYPFATLLVLGNRAIAVLFLFIGIISILRHYLNVAVVIEEMGTMDLVDGDTEEERWANKSRLSDLVIKITQDRSRVVWSRVLWAFGLIFVGIFLTSIGISSESTDDLELTYLHDFYYPPVERDMRYPSCSLAEINNVFGVNATVADYIYLAKLAYNKPSLIQSELDEWFKGMDVEFDTETVEQYRRETGTENSAANFKLITIEESNTAIVAIRGTQNSLDLFADAQLWSAAMLVQTLRAILPLGEIWTPILDELALAMNFVESEGVSQVSFYRTITPFVEQLKASGNYSSVQVTGHSLGGGLSMIVGAQAEVPAVSVSGPNSLISGRSFNPPVRKEDLNRYTFNIIPENDIVPLFDDVAANFQNIRCNADFNDFIGCHDAMRSLCEIMYTCGSGDRPALCFCHQVYGFPQPLPLPGTERTFEEACPAVDEE